MHELPLLSPYVEGRDAMNKNVLAAGLTAVALVWSAVVALAQQFGTAPEARAMLDRAVTELKSNEAAALAKFNDKENKQFRDRDLYVFCFNVSDGKFTAHPNPSIMGTDVRALKVKDDPLGQRLFDQVKEGAVTTVDYSFPKPGTTEPVPKESYITRVGGQGCGAITNNSAAIGPCRGGFETRPHIRIKSVQPSTEP
jgi:hypothetical protein